MSDLQIVVAAAVIALLGVSVVVTFLLLAARRRAAAATGGTRTVRVKGGRAYARLVVHDDHGLVYEVIVRRRGQATTSEYLPPAWALVQQHLDGEGARW